MPNIAAIGVGSNIEPEKNIEKAKSLLFEKFNLKTFSKFVKTKPIGVSGQPDFLNGAVLIETDLGRIEVISILKEIEKKMGRAASEDKFGPRTIDLDLVVWNGEVAHPDFYSRDFLRAAIQEIMPQSFPPS